MVRSIRCILFLVVCGLISAAAFADTYNLVNGEVVTGDLLVASANDLGVQIKVGDGEYKKLSWANFSQEDLKKLAENPKFQPFVEPFIEITQDERIKMTEVPIKLPPRLERPAPQSLFGAFFSSGLGFFIMMLLYAASIYAGYEIAIFRAQSPALVCGVSAVAPVIGPIVFLCMPTKIKREAEELAEEMAVAEAEGALPAPAAGADEVNPMLDASVAHPSGLKLAHEPEPAKPALPHPTVYQRGQFTFNKRFFETKFVGFFGAVRREADRDMVLVFKTGKGEFTAQRISRIAPSDLHLQVIRGHTTEEMSISFQEILEVRHQHKNA